MLNLIGMAMDIQCQIYKFNNNQNSSNNRILSAVEIFKIRTITGEASVDETPPRETF